VVTGRQGMSWIELAHSDGLFFKDDELSGCMPSGNFLVKWVAVMCSLKNQRQRILRYFNTRWTLVVPKANTI